MSPRAPENVAGAMWRCRAMWRTYPRDILTGPRRSRDIAPALADILQCQLGDDGADAGTLRARTHLRAVP